MRVLETIEGVAHQDGVIGILASLTLDGANLVEIITSEEATTDTTEEVPIKEGMNEKLRLTVSRC